MSFRDMPASLHLTVSAATAASVPDFLVALDESVTAAVATGPIVVDEGLRAAAASIDPRHAGRCGLRRPAGARRARVGHR
jgi:sphinganine-1-phosphate aldolase